MAAAHDVWLQEALVREYDRGDDFEGVTGAAREASWFNPRWRSVLVKWYKEIARVYTMCPTTVENAVFYMDSFFAITLQRGHELVVRDFQLVGMVALLVSSKMFSAGSQLKVADLIQLAPQLNLTSKDLCAMELTLIQTLKFNLLVPSSAEFVHVLLSRLEDVCSDGDDHDAQLLGPLHAWAAKYLHYLEKEFSNVEFNQSEKALASAFCAMARWSIVPVPLASAEHEAEAMKVALATILGKAEPSGDLAQPSVARMHVAWRSVVTHSDLASICTVRTRFIERRIVSAISHDKDTVYPAALKNASSSEELSSCHGPIMHGDKLAASSATPADVKIPIAVRPSAPPIAAPSSLAAQAPTVASSHGLAAGKVPSEGGELASSDASTAFRAVAKRDLQEVRVVLQGQVVHKNTVHPTPSKTARAFKAVADDDTEGSVSPDDVTKFECGVEAPAHVAAAAAVARGNNNKAIDFDAVASPMNHKRRASSRFGQQLSCAHSKRQK